MRIKVFVSDFDGTLVTNDILDVICEINKRGDDSKRINEEYLSGKRDGFSALKERTEFLTGVNVSQIRDSLNKNNYLIKGVVDLFAFLRSHNIITILSSGNIIPVLEYYQELLKIDYIIGTPVFTQSNIISGVDLSNYANGNFKADNVKKIFNSLNVCFDEVVVMGDSVADIPVFELAKHTIAINSKGGIADKVLYNAGNSYSKVIEMLDNCILRERQTGRAMRAPTGDRYST